MTWRERKWYVLFSNLMAPRFSIDVIFLQTTWTLIWLQKWAQQSSLYMEHVNHHHLCSTMINEAHIYWCLVTKLFLEHKILNALNLVLFCFCFLFFVFVFIFFLFFFFLVRLRIMKLLHLLKAKRTHDFRWKKPNEDKTQSYNNITVDFEHSLAY